METNMSNDTVQVENAAEELSQAELDVVTGGGGVAFLPDPNEHKR